MTYRTVLFLIISAFAIATGVNFAASENRPLTVAYMMLGAAIGLMFTIIRRRFA